ncbi:hypothetical protein B0H19DRAFT_1079452 [Mycena capillaripes]|nr:hypothetical protein B0H19DRAFT_1079452 [Mycena capillaripes]
MAVVKDILFLHILWPLHFSMSILNDLRLKELHDHYAPSRQNFSSPPNIVTAFGQMMMKLISSSRCAVDWTRGAGNGYRIVCGAAARTHGAERGSYARGSGARLHGEAEGRRINRRSARAEEGRGAGNEEQRHGQQGLLRVVSGAHGGRMLRVWTWYGVGGDAPCVWPERNREGTYYSSRYMFFREMMFMAWLQAKKPRKPKPWPDQAKPSQFFGLRLALALAWGDRSQSQGLKPWLREAEKTNFKASFWVNTLQIQVEH